MINVLVVVYGASANEAGASLVLRKLILGLSSDFTFRIVTHEGTYFSEKRSEFERKGVEVVVFPMRKQKKLDYVGFQKTLKKYLECTNSATDIILTSNINLNSALSSVRRTRIPIVILSYSLNPLYTPWAICAFRLANKIVLEYPESDNLAFKLLRMFGYLKKLKSKTVVIRTPVDFARNPSTSYDKERTMGKLVYTYCGNIHPKKNLLRFALALREVAKNTKQQVVFRVVGKPVREKDERIIRKIEALANKSVKIEYEGAVPHEEISRYYETTDFFVLPSFQEGTSGSLREAVLSGVPCLASRIPGNLFVLKGFDALDQVAFAPCSKYSMKRAILFSLEHLDQLTNMASKIRKRKIEEFSSEEFLESFRALFTSLKMKETCHKGNEHS